MTNPTQTTIDILPEEVISHILYFSGSPSNGSVSKLWNAAQNDATHQLALQLFQTPNEKRNFTLQDLKKLDQILHSRMSREQYQAVLQAFPQPLQIARFQQMKMCTQSNQVTMTHLASLPDKTHAANYAISIGDINTLKCLLPQIPGLLQPALHVSGIYFALIETAVINQKRACLREMLRHLPSHILYKECTVNWLKNRVLKRTHFVNRDPISSDLKNVAFLLQEFALHIPELLDSIVPTLLQNAVNFDDQPLIILLLKHAEYKLWASTLITACGQCGVVEYLLAHKTFDLNTYGEALVAAATARNAKSCSQLRRRLQPFLMDESTASIAQNYLSSASQRLR